RFASGEILRVVRREIAERRGDSPSELSAVRGNFPGQNIQERGLREVLGAEQSDLVALLQNKTHVFQNRNAFDGLGNPVDRQDVVPQLALAIKADERLFARRYGHLDELQLFELFAARRGLTGFRSVRAEALDEALELFGLVRGLFVL